MKRYTVILILLVILLILCVFVGNRQESYQSSTPTSSMPTPTPTNANSYRMVCLSNWRQCFDNDFFSSLENKQDFGIGASVDEFLTNYDVNTWKQFFSELPLPTDYALKSPHAQKDVICFPKWNMCFTEDYFWQKTSPFAKYKIYDLPTCYNKLKTLFGATVGKWKDVVKEGKYILNPPTIPFVIEDEAAKMYLCQEGGQTYCFDEDYLKSSKNLYKQQNWTSVWKLFQGQYRDGIDTIFFAPKDSELIKNYKINPESW